MTSQSVPSFSAFLGLFVCISRHFPPFSRAPRVSIFSPKRDRTRGRSPIVSAGCHHLVVVLTRVHVRSVFPRLFACISRHTFLFSRAPPVSFFFPEQSRTNDRPQSDCLRRLSSLCRRPRPSGRALCFISVVCLYPPSYFPIFSSSPGFAFLS